MSFQQLADILRQARQERDQNDRTPPVACPYDGEPLEKGPGGVLHCPAGNYTYDGLTVV